MVKGVSVKFRSYQDTIPQLLKLLKFDQEIKKHNRIVLKPHLLTGNPDLSTKVEFIEAVLKFCTENKSPGTEVFIVEGADGPDTDSVFEDFGYRKLSEKYGIGLVDLNKAETETVLNGEFLRFEEISYPKILMNSFLISLPPLNAHEELGISASLDTMIGAYPASKYRGFFSRTKNKIRRWPIKYSVHDILKVKMPDFSIIDASNHGYILAGKPIDMDKQGAKMLGLDWRNLSHLKMIDESFAPKPEVKE